MPRVLIVEDEPMLRSSMARGVARMEGVEVTDVGTVEHAVQALTAAPPDVLVSDIDLPGRSGIELLGELGQNGLRIPVVFVTGFLKAFRSQIPHHANVLVLEKPVSLDELRRVIGERLPEGRDSTPPFSVIDYLQLACMGRRSVQLEVKGEAGSAGWIRIVGGALWSAQDDEGEGEAALRRLAFADGAHIGCRALRGEPGTRNIETPLEAVLLDAARLADEAARDSERGNAAPGFDPFASGFDPFAEPSTSPSLGSGSGPDVESEPATETEPEPEPRSFEDSAFTEAWEQGLHALLARDYAAAYAAFRTALDFRPDDAGANANVARLQEMGYGAKEEDRG